MLKTTWIRRTLVILIFLSVTLPAVARAHEHWLDISSFFPAKGSEVEVTVCSGHDYPGSVFALKDEVTGTLTVSCPDGNDLSLETARGEKSRSVKFAPVAAGVYLLHLELKRPKMERPAYEMKAVMITGVEKDDPSLYSCGEGLEIVPLEAISRLSAGEDLKVRVLMDGEAVASELEVIPAKGRTGWYKASPGEPAVIRVGSSGRYLITTNISGRGCSLVFEIGGED